MSKPLTRAEWLEYLDTTWKKCLHEAWDKEWNDMTVPLNTDTRETYVNRQADEHLHWAEVHHRLGHGRSSWLQLLYYAMAEDIYGTHWDKLNDKRQSD